MFDKGRVALIQKNRPAWQAGKFNAIGGHIEQFEDGITAMVREFEEETGLKTERRHWKRFAILHGNDSEVQFFCAEGSTEGIRSVTDERVFVVYPLGIQTELMIPNLRWLIPAAQLALAQPSPVLSVVECEL
jgi:8-oxo-dGTP diphosphatase